MGAICLLQPVVVQERSKLTDLEIMLHNWLPGTGISSGAPEPADGKRRLIRGEGLVARISNDYEPQLPVVREDIPGPAGPCHVGTARLLETVDQRTRLQFSWRRTPNSLSDSLEGCFSCGVLTHTTDQCQTFVSVLAYGMASRLHRRPVYPGTGISSGAPEPADGKRRLIRGEGLVARISNDYEPQLPVVREDIPGPAGPCHVGTARLLETVDQRTRLQWLGVIFDCLVRIRTIQTTMCYMEKDMTEKCDRSTCEMSGRWIRGRRTTHVERGVHSWTISIGFSRPTFGSGTYLPQSHRWICRTVRVMSMMLNRTRFRCR